MNKRILLCSLAFFPLAPLAAESAAAPAVPVEASAAPGDPASLRRQAEALIRQDKKSAQPYLLMGRASFMEGRRGKAMSAFNKALKRDPHCADAYYWRGRVFEDKGKLDEAANEYQAALKASPGHLQAQASWKKLSDRLTAADAK